MLGHCPSVIPCTLNLAGLRAQLEAQRPDLVFNLVELLEGHGCLITMVPILLEALRLAYTGAAAEGMWLSSHKTLAKARMVAAGLPTPQWVRPYPPEPDRDAKPVAFEPGCYIYKSVWEHASFNLDGQAVVWVPTLAEMEAHLRRVAPRLGGLCFAERFVDGREFNFSVLAGPEGPQVLPPVEIVFLDFPPDKPKIVDYRAKWAEDSFEYIHTVRRFEFPPEDAPLLTSLRQLALRCWAAFDLRGYARIDFRIDAQENPFILEVNANPCLSPNGGFAAAVEQAGISYPEAIARILTDSSLRVGTQQPSLTGVPPVPVPAPPGGAGLGAKPATFTFRYEAQPDDARVIRRLIEATGVFTTAEADVAVELVTDRLGKGAASDYHFVLADHDGRCAGYACYGLIPCTVASYDLYWIAVHPDFQRHGLGKLLIAETERRIGAAGGQRVYIETSLRAHYAGTRAFYERCGYGMASMLEDFYAPGDGKATFRKAI